MTPKQSFKKDSLFQVNETSALMEFLLQNLPHKNRNNIKSLLKQRQILVNQVVQTPFDFPLAKGDEVRVCWNKAADKDISTGLRLMYEDANYYVLNKEAGLLCIPIKQNAQTSVYAKLLQYAKRKNPRAKLFLVKSIDKDSSGLVIFAKGEEQQTTLIEALNKTGIYQYHAVLEGELPIEKGNSVARFYESKAFKMHFTQDAAVPEYQANYEVLHTKNRMSALKFTSLGAEGKHQIRMLALNLGFPIIGDKKYGSQSSPIKRLALHRSSIAFKDPFIKTDQHFECAKPRKFSRLL